MIRKLTDLFLNDFDLLTEELYLCWHNSYDHENKQLDVNKLRAQIHSYGFYEHKKPCLKKIPLSFRNKLHFNSLSWVNEYTDLIPENLLSEFINRNKKVINEIERNIFSQTNKEDKISYANIILQSLDKSNIHNQLIVESILNLRYKEFFEIVLNQKLIFENNNTLEYNELNRLTQIYNLTLKLIGHFDFIEKLINLFNCFGINLLFITENSKNKLYVFDDKNLIQPVDASHSKPEYINQLIDSEESHKIIFPKFRCSHTDECLIKIMLYLSNNMKLINTNSDLWLFWFNRKCIKIPLTLKWNDSPTMLSNVIQHLCGCCISKTIKTAFKTNVFVKPTWKTYQSSKTYKEIEQIITISKQKKY